MTQWTNVLISISCLSYGIEEVYYNANRSLQPLTALRQQEIIMTDSYLYNPKISDDSIHQRFCTKRLIQP